jgi:hypothetical protein
MPDPIQNNPKVFISYSHDSQEHKDRVLALSDRLRADGIDCIIDQYETSPPEGWARWCDRNIEASSFVLVACTNIYEQRFKGADTTEKGKGVKWERRRPLLNMRSGIKQDTTQCSGQKPIPVKRSSPGLQHWRKGR